MKTCFRCQRQLPIDEFYRHPMMADGHLGKCKDCTRQDVKANRTRRLDYYQACDRKRGKLPHRLRANRDRSRLRRSRPSCRVLRAALPSDAQTKKMANTALGNAIRDGRVVRPDRCEGCGSSKPLDGHHYDYRLVLSVMWLCKLCHGRQHWKEDQS